MGGAKIYNGATLANILVNGLKIMKADMRSVYCNSQFPKLGKNAGQCFYVHSESKGYKIFFIRQDKTARIKAVISA